MSYYWYGFISGWFAASALVTISGFIYLLRREDRRAPASEGEQK
ncbi:hypothetical protein [Burkholderia pseudomallei]|nr:hypothetical protein [Burkholderia pseudomallei]